MFQSVVICIFMISAEAFGEYCKFNGINVYILLCLLDTIHSIIVYGILTTKYSNFSSFNATLY